LWSCGVILYILLCGYPPFNGSRDDIIIKTVLAGKYSIDEPEWAEVSSEAKDLVSKLLTYNPVERISAFEALKHPWITKYADSDRVDKIAMKRTLQNL
jgi:calcium-dependent protein kinase